MGLPFINEESEVQNQNYSVNKTQFLFVIPWAQKIKKGAKNT